MLSVVIPTLNAGERLPPLIAVLREVADEIVVADGGSTDDTRNVAQHEGAVVINAAPGRGRQLAAGAKAAHGDWLLFLHADSTMGQGWQQAVQAQIDDPFGPHWAAYFRLVFDDDSRQARRLERMVAWRSRVLGLPYGDQGLLLHRSLYDRAGGFADIELMEDVALVRAIGRRWLKPLDAAIITSAERFQKAGWWKRSARNLLCLMLYFFKASPRWIKRIYG
ncbi:MAG: TIGR04283 family arsenosugar biosynthesis glycosyltransferase [Alphaproteobacteria bacterium]